MTTIDHTAALQTLSRKIEALGISDNARRCAADNDLAGLAYIANIADGQPGQARRKLTEMMDLADYLQGVMPKLIAPRR